jgi:hypothetical protein
MIKSERMRWEVLVASMEENRPHKIFWWESQKERNHQEDLGRSRSLMLKWILEK